MSTTPLTRGRRRVAAALVLTVALFTTVGGSAIAHAAPVGGQGSAPTATGSPTPTPTPTDSPVPTPSAGQVSPPGATSPRTAEPAQSPTPTSTSADPSTPTQTPTAEQSPAPTRTATPKATVSAAAPTSEGAKAIKAKYDGSATVRSRLGKASGSVECGLANGGCIQKYAKGAIIWSKSSGARMVLNGVVNTKYVNAGREKGALGYPTSDYACDQPNGGCKQSYQKGHIYWSHSTGARIVMAGPINYQWLKAGGPGGTLGYPTSDQINGLKDGGAKQRFRKGTMYTSPASGTHYTVAGNVNHQYQRAGEESGRYGYPTGRQYAVTGGHAQRFQNGTISSAPKVSTPKVDKRCLSGRVMCASKKDRKMRWMVNGKVVKTFDARYGCARTPSDNGSFKVYWKSYNHTSTIYGTWMPRAMFYNGGEAVHYSGDFAARGWAGCSGGCVNIRDWNGINWLYDQVKVGDKVVVY